MITGYNIYKFDFFYMSNGSAYEIFREKSYELLAFEKPAKHTEEKEEP